MSLAGVSAMVTLWPTRQAVHHNSPDNLALSA